MKKNYETPTVEKIAFQYRDQVVVASGCQSVWINTGDDYCSNGDNKHQEYLK